MRLDKTWQVLAAALGLAFFSGAASAEAAASADSSAYTRPSELVAIDGTRRLNLVCMGKGAPTVILEAGAGDGSRAWRKVQPELAKSTRVCAYDRAGYGFSDPISRPADADNAVDDLSRLLNKAHLGDQVVLVGHSVGGLYAELFAARYPEQVAGLVLVDPTGMEDFRLVREMLTDEERAQQRAAHEKRLASYGRCLDMTRVATDAAELADNCKATPIGDAALDSERARQMSQPKYWAAFQSEMTNFWPVNHPDGGDSVITSQVRARALVLGSTPLIVLKSPGRVPPGERGERLRAESTAVAERLAATSSRGKLVQVEAGHYIQNDRPEAVIDAVREVLGDVAMSAR